MSDSRDAESEASGQVALTLAARGADLFAALEAAQYAHLIDAGEPSGADQARETAAFLDLFRDVAETWDEKTAMEQAAALGQLDDRLDGIGAVGLRVHWGVAERRFITQQGEAVTLPVALLKICAAEETAPTTRVPLVLGLNET